MRYIVFEIKDNYDTEHTIHPLRKTDDFELAMNIMYEELCSNRWIVDTSTGEFIDTQTYTRNDGEWRRREGEELSMFPICYPKGYEETDDE